MGRMEVRIDSFPSRKMPPTTLMTGVGGGHDLNLRKFARDGVVICGRLRSIAEGQLSFADDAEQILADSDNAFAELKRAADDYVRRSHIDAPEEEKPNPNEFTGPMLPVPVLNLKVANITSVIWATGYKFDFDWLRIPVFGEAGVPLQERGVTRFSNLYFLGLHWMHTRKSGLLFGVGDDARYLSEYMEARS